MVQSVGHEGSLHSKTPPGWRKQMTIMLTDLKTIPADPPTFTVPVGEAIDVHQFDMSRRVRMCVQLEVGSPAPYTLLYAKLTYVCCVPAVSDTVVLALCLACGHRSAGQTLVAAT